ncbi:MAG: hypothetical protein HC903_12340 [Methylacidiphilales bacterium]|nr:hypothetical protein [Candidatus Methylacidiphilales bacterium]
MPLRRIVACFPEGVQGTRIVHPTMREAAKRLCTVQSFTYPQKATPKRLLLGSPIL